MRAILKNYSRNEFSNTLLLMKKMQRGNLKTIHAGKSTNSFITRLKSNSLCTNQHHCEP